MPVNAPPPIGIVFFVEDYFAKVFWTDGEICLESMVDLRLMKD